MKYRIALATAAIIFGAASAASAKTCEERFAAQKLSPTGLVGNAPIWFEGAEYFVRPGEPARSICAKADKARLAITTRDELIRTQKVRIDSLDAQVSQLKTRLGDTNYFKRHAYLGWAGWPIAFIFVFGWILISIGIRIGRRYRGRL